MMRSGSSHRLRGLNMGLFAREVRGLPLENGVAN